jgi:hypothetical protein
MIAFKWVIGTPGVKDLIIDSLSLFYERHPLIAWRQNRVWIRRQNNLARIFDIVPPEWENLKTFFRDWVDNIVLRRETLGLANKRPEIKGVFPRDGSELVNRDLSFVSVEIEDYPKEKGENNSFDLEIWAKDGEDGYYFYKNFSNVTGGIFKAGITEELPAYTLIIWNVKVTDFKNKVVPGVYRFTTTA